MSAYSISRFLEYFEKNNLLDAKALNEIKIDALKNAIPVEEYLTKRSLSTPEHIMQAKAYAMQVQLIKLDGVAASPQALSHISEGIARQYAIFPFEYDQKNSIIKIASSDPLNLETISFLEKKTGKTIVPFLADPKEIEEAINIQYQQSISPTVTSALEEFGGQKKQQEKTTTNMGDRMVKEPPISKIVNTMLEFAVKARASDIHVEPQETRTRIRYRIDGILNEKLVLPSSLHESLVSRIKILAQMRIDEKRIPQDGRFTFKIGSEEVDLRVSSLPTVHGEKIVMRLLKKTGGIPSLPDLGLQGVQMKHLELAITKPYGIILVTGPTGSGKTTTLYSVLSRLNQSSVNILTLEDPVEYEIPGINQVQINPQAGLTFANGLRSFLRQDPNIILVGEIRDQETTALAIQAALTGHLVFSTLHTNDASTAIPRLLDLGAEPFLIASVLNAALGQRIVRRVCPSCKESYQADALLDKKIREVLGNFLPQEFNGKPLMLWRGKGCTECGNTGYYGRVGIFEIIVTSNAVNKLILQRANAEVIEKQAQEEGLITMKQDGFLKTLRGETTIEEILRVAEDM
ncbi:MAG: GspE/PulE family protein [Candidatus Roizmanbacteria bacterium]|nr:GspE/PulE family protein [Candidatus Roizmanbacteria bacterium]